MGGACSTYWEIEEVHTEFWWGNLMDRPDGRPKLNGRIIQGGSNMTGTNCDLFTHKSFPVIFEPPCTKMDL
jgi:hypothetical protein